MIYAAPHSIAMEGFNAMSFSRRILAVVVIYVVCAAPGCQPIQFEWQGPTTAFKSLDLNRDGIVTRPEWEAKFGATISRANASVWEFDRLDCERDGRLTWTEYFKGKFKGRRCDTAMIRFYLEAPVDPPDGSVEVLGGTGSVSNELLFSSYSESPGSESLEYLLELQCDQVRTASTDIECLLSNRMEEDTLTLIIFSLTVENSESRSTSSHAKTVWVPPRSSAPLVVRSRDSTVHGIEIRDFRVLRR